MFSELKDQAGEVEGVVESESYKAALDKEVSPIKEKILTTFAQISPNSDKKSPEEDTGSWLTNVKGKLAKTVDTSLEKYNELKAERERAKLASKSSGGNSLDIEDDLDQSEPSILSEDSTNQSLELKMSQSQSESTLTDQTSSSNISKESQQCRPQSEIFEFDSKDFDKSQPQDIPTSPTTDTPTKSKKKFAIPSLFSRTSTPNVVAGSPGKEDLNKIETPKRTVRSLFSSYVGKNSQPQPDLLSSSPSCSSSVPLLDPFSGLENEKLIISEDQHDAGNESPEVEEGLDAAELSLTPEDLSHEDDGNTVTTAPGDIKHVPHHHNHYQHQQPHHSPPPGMNMSMNHYYYQLDTSQLSLTWSVLLLLLFSLLSTSCCHSGSVASSQVLLSPVFSPTGSVVSSTHPPVSPTHLNHHLLNQLRYTRLLQVNNILSSIK